MKSPSIKLSSIEVVHTLMIRSLPQYILDWEWVVEDGEISRGKDGLPQWNFFRPFAEDGFSKEDSCYDLVWFKEKRIGIRRFGRMGWVWI